MSSDKEMCFFQEQIHPNSFSAEYNSDLVRCLKETLQSNPLSDTYLHCLAVQTLEFGHAVTSWNRLSSRSQSLVKMPRWERPVYWQLEECI